MNEFDIFLMCSAIGGIGFFMGYLAGGIHKEMEIHEVKKEQKKLKELIKEAIREFEK